MPRRLARLVRFALLALLPPSVAATAHAQAWSWFAEPFSVRVAMTHPQAGPMEGVVVVDAQAVRTEWSFGGMVQVSVARPEGDGVRVRSLMPDGSVVELWLTGVDAFELLVQRRSPVLGSPPRAGRPGGVRPAVTRPAVAQLAPLARIIHEG